MPTYFSILAVSILLLTGFSQGVNDNEEQEKAMLLQLASELAFLDTVINRAEHQRDTAARYQFDYAALRNDLRLVTRGITDHLSREQREPRTLPTLSGDYQ